MNKQLEQIVSPMIESILHLLKIHRKVILGNPAIIVQDMLRKTPETLNTVNVILGLFVDHALAVINGVMLTPAFQRIVAPKLVGVVDRSLPCLLPDDLHQFISRYSLNNLCVDPCLALQKAKNNAFTLCSSSMLPLTSDAKVALVHFYLAGEFTTLQFSHMVDRLAGALVHARNGLVIYAQIVCQFVRRLYLVESFQNAELSTQLCKRLLFSTRLLPATYIAAMRTIDLERTAENTLFTPQKVGRAPENILFSSNHKGILVPVGYECH